MTRRIGEIAVDAEMLAWDKALECLRAMDELPHNDLARPEYLSAAQVFATLATAEASE